MNLNLTNNLDKIKEWNLMIIVAPRFWFKDENFLVWIRRVVLSKVMFKVDKVSQTEANLG